MGDDADDDGPVYYVISDLHIGGDEQLERIDFLDGLAKFDELIERYPALFEQLRATGESVPITMLPGNHDHELAAYDEYVDRLAAYNVELVSALSITRPVGDRTIHFEHGHQQDPNNRIEDFGNPHATPMGYFYNVQVTSRAGRLSDRGRYNWLKDVQAVTPTERVPNWLASKYFYREMNPFLRYATVPFLLLLNVSVLLALFAGLDLTGVWTLPVEDADAFLAQFGLAGAAVHLLLVLNAAVAGLLILVGIPLYVFARDVSHTVDRFGLTETDLTVDPEAPYREAAREVFDERPETAVFCYGHTHRPSMTDVDGRLLVNTGTWLKRLHRRNVVAGYLPPVFYPSYQLCVVRVAAEDDGVVVEYEEIDKPNPTSEELTRTERLLTLGREPNPTLPGRAVVTGDGIDASSATVE